MSADGCKLFDKFSDIAIGQCSSLIQSLQNKIMSDETLRLEDESRHLRLVAHLLNIYLKDVCSIVVQMRELKKARLQRIKKFGRLSNLVDMWEKILIQQDKAQDCSFYSHLKMVSKYQPEVKEAQKLPDYEMTTDLELEQLLAENIRVFHRLTSTNPEIEQIESRLIEIQQLQDLFNEKIMEQDRDIDVVHTKTQHTLNTLEDANQFIREVLANKASRRVIALFSLLVLSFTLLFVDWYNP